MIEIVATIGVIAAVFCSPLIAARVMGRDGGIGKSALTAFLVLFIAQFIGPLSELLGPAGGVLAIMLWVAGWFQVVKVLWGTDTADTVVFIFWQVFFQLLITSLVALVAGGMSLGWMFGFWS